MSHQNFTLPRCSTGQPCDQCGMINFRLPLTPAVLYFLSHLGGCASWFCIVLHGSGLCCQLLSGPLLPSQAVNPRARDLKVPSAAGACESCEGLVRFTARPSPLIVSDLTRAYWLQACESQLEPNAHSTAALLGIRMCFFGYLDFPMESLLAGKKRGVNCLRCPATVPVSFS